MRPVYEGPPNEADAIIDRFATVLAEPQPSPRCTTELKDSKGVIRQAFLHRLEAEDDPVQLDILCAGYLQLSRFQDMSLEARNQVASLNSLRRAAADANPTQLAAMVPLMAQLIPVAEKYSSAEASEFAVLQADVARYAHKIGGGNAHG